MSKSAYSSELKAAGIARDHRNNQQTTPTAPFPARFLGRKNSQLRRSLRGNCYNCGKVGHMFVDCRAPRKEKKKGHANIVEMKEEVDNLCAMLSECNLIGNSREWWIETRAPQHVCSNKELFTSYVASRSNEIIFMANATTIKMKEHERLA